MFETLVKRLTKYPVLAKMVQQANSNTPSIYIGMTNLNVSIRSQKSFEQRVNNFLNMVPDHKILEQKIGDYVKIQEGTKKEISDRIMKIQEIFESLVEALVIEETKKFNEKINKLAKE